MGPSDPAMLVVDGDPLRGPALASLVRRAVNEVKRVAWHGPQLGHYLGSRWSRKKKSAADLHPQIALCCTDSAYVRVGI